MVSAWLAGGCVSPTVTGGYSSPSPLSAVGAAVNIRPIGDLHAGEPRCAGRASQESAVLLRRSHHRPPQHHACRRRLRHPCSRPSPRGAECRRRAAIQSVNNSYPRLEQGLGKYTCLLLLPLLMLLALCSLRRGYSGWRGKHVPTIHRIGVVANIVSCLQSAWISGTAGGGGWRAGGVPRRS